MSAQPIALITGGSSGIGYALSEQLGKEGYEIILVARNEENLSQSKQNLERSGVTVRTFKADISDQNELEKVSDYLKSTSRKISFLILNAGVLHVNTLLDTKISDLKYVININLWGTVLSTRIFLPHMENNSRILFVSSALGMIGAAGYTSYCATKAGIINFAAALRRELIGRISVYVACPGDVNTPQYKFEMQSAPPWLKNVMVRGQALTAETAAQRILKKSCGRRFKIFTSLDMYFLLSFFPRIIPEFLFNFFVDRLLPRPPSNSKDPF